MDNYINKCVPIKHYFWILKFEYDIASLCHKILFLVEFSLQLLKNVKVSLSLHCAREGGRLDLA
jgi:hypothetical protein